MEGRSQRIAESTAAGVDSKDEGDEEYPSKCKPVIKEDTVEYRLTLKTLKWAKRLLLEASEGHPLTTPTNNELRMVGCGHPAASRQRCC